MEKFNYENDDIEILKIEKMINEFGVEINKLPEKLENVIPHEYEPDFLFSLTFEGAVRLGIISFFKNGEIEKYSNIFNRAKELYSRINAVLSDGKQPEISENKIMMYVMLFKEIGDGLIYGDLRGAKESLEQLEEICEIKAFEQQQ